MQDSIDLLNLVLNKINEKNDALISIESFKPKIESDVHVLSKQVSYNMDKINEIKLMSTKVNEFDVDRKVLYGRIDDLSKKIEKFESILGSVENLRNMFDLRFDNFSKDFERMKIISEQSKSENISQHKDLSNIDTRLSHIEDKMDSLMDKLNETSNKADNTEERIDRIMKMIAAISVGVVVSIVNILMSYLKK